MGEMCMVGHIRRKAGGDMGTEKGLVCHLKEFALDPIGSRGLQ